MACRTTKLAEYFSARQVAPVPWTLAVDTHFDLAIAASHGGPLHELKTPLIVLPHGMGYNKILNRKPVFSLSTEWLLHDGQVIASSLVLSPS